MDNDDNEGWELIVIPSDLGAPVPGLATGPAAILEGTGLVHSVHSVR